MRQGDLHVRPRRWRTQGTWWVQATIASGSRRSWCLAAWRRAAVTTLTREQANTHAIGDTLSHDGCSSSKITVAQPCNSDVAVLPCNNDVAVLSCNNLGASDTRRDEIPNHRHQLLSFAFVELGYKSVVQKQKSSKLHLKTINYFS